MRAGAAYAATAVTLASIFYTMMSSAWYGGTFTGNMSAVSLDRVAIASTWFISATAEHVTIETMICTLVSIATNLRSISFFYIRTTFSNRAVTAIIVHTMTFVDVRSMSVTIIYTMMFANVFSRQVMQTDMLSLSIIV